MRRIHPGETVHTFFDYCRNACTPNAGLRIDRLIHRLADGGTEVLLVHPGDTFQRGRDVGAWQIPKGRWKPGDDPRAAAGRGIGKELRVTVDAVLTPPL